MSCLWLGIICLFLLPALVGLSIVGLQLYVRRNYLDVLLRIFCEKPLFIIPRGEPREGAEDVRFPTTNSMLLKGCYLKTDQYPRKGVILFGLEYGSNRWACLSYCEALIQSGYDVFAFEPRNQGDSDGIEGYEPLQWLTRYEAEDMQAAVDYLKSRDDADPNGIGFFGLSKGANAGIYVAANDPYVRCLATDGAFGTHSVMVPYMRKWVSLYNSKYLVHGLLPRWFYGWIASAAIHKIGRRRHVQYLHIEDSMAKLQRPLKMIHGANDTYIKVEMAKELFRRAAGPKDFWVVEGAKHNQSLQVAGEDYIRNIVGFFDHHLGGIEPGTPSQDSVDFPPSKGDVEVQTV